MKKRSSRSVMVFTILFSSLFAMPLMSRAEVRTSDASFNPRDIVGAFRNFGPSGEMLADIFELLFNQTLNIDQQELIDGVYVLNATKEKTYNGTYVFADRGDEREIQLLPWVDNGLGGNKYDDTGINGYAYCVIDKNGNFTYNITVGASLTLIIWDQDGSFITAAKKIIDFVKILQTNPSMETIISKGVELGLWILTHLNDIFTGDELFVFNPITYEKFEMLPSNDFSLTKTWYETGPDWGMDIPGDNVIGTSKMTQWNTTAANLHDSRMEWLLTNLTAGSLAKEIFTTFQFDLFQLWVKNFEIHIDLGALQGLAGGGSVNPAEILNGMDIEFYIFTHRLEGAYLYNDLDGDNKVTVNYNETGQIDPEGNPIIRPESNEISQRIMLGTVGSFNFQDPTPIDTNSFSWGITLNNAQIIPVPLGIDLNSYVGAKREDLNFIDFKCQFKKEVGSPGPEGQSLNGSVKLEQNFGPWNGGAGPKNNITDLDLAIVYISSVFHFKFNVDTENLAAANASQTDVTDTYSGNSLQIGNYLAQGGSNLELVDIAGPNYILSNFTAPGNKPGIPQTSHPASTQIVPISLWSFEGDAHAVRTGDVNTQADDFAADINLDISHNVMYYGVCYPEFNGTGTGIWHDPTFNVYMIFTPENAGFWALILLVAGVGLVGIATVLIKRKKDREGF